MNPQFISFKMKESESFNLTKHDFQDSKDSSSEQVGDMFRCSFYGCNKLFTQKGNLKTHKLIHVCK